MSQTELLGHTERYEITESDALFSPDMVYRYGLMRGWELQAGLVNFVLLNPSTADAETDDPTIRRCIDYAQRWGYGGLAVTNLYALRSTDPKGLWRVGDPIGPENMSHLQMHAALADLVVCGWGNNAEFSWAVEAANLLQNATESGKIYCLGVNQTGHPVHPLYQPKDARLIELRYEEV